MKANRGVRFGTVGFGFGLSLAVLPSIGPIFASVLVISQRWRLRRHDVPWLVASGVFGVAWWTSGTPWDGLRGVGTVLGPWIVFRTFHELSRRNGRTRLAKPMVIGLLTGLVATVIVGLLQMTGGVFPERSSSLLGAIAWQNSPALFGHGTLVLAGSIAIATAGLRTTPWLALAIALPATLISGSLGAVLAWTVLVASLTLFDGSRSFVRRLLTASTLTTLVWSFIAFAPIVGWGQIGFLLTGTSAEGPGDNLLTGTELPHGDWWIDHWVTVDAAPASVGSATDPLLAYTVNKKGEASWLRLQQAVPLEAGASYTLSAWIEQPSNPDAVPSLQGWGRNEGMTTPLVLTGTLHDGVLDASVSGPGTLVSLDQEPGALGWTRVHATFRVDTSTGPITWFVGFVPDARVGMGGPARFAGLMLERGEAVSPYQAAGAAFGLSFEHARLPMWQAAWEGFLARPWTGWGEGSFGAWYHERRPESEQINIIPQHPHNAALAVLFERGLLGLAGFVVLLVALAAPAFRRRDGAMLGFFAAVMVLGLFDTTFFRGALIYPIAAIAGWRSTPRDDHEHVTLPPGRPVVVRAVLASVDLAVMAGALLLGRIASPLADAAGDANLQLAGLLLWPALIWREGLYPGYGMTAAEELRRHVTAWAQASVALLMLDTLTPLGSRLSLGGYAVFLLTSLVALPVGRAIAKRALHSTNSWGRDVVVMGAGQTGRRVVRTLCRTPLDGLHPVAVFDDDPNLVGTDVHGVPVLGTLDEAGVYARRNDVRHVIAAISSLNPARRAHALAQGSMPFTIVQYVPRIDALPSHDVVAKEFDGLMILESKVGLASGWNRAFKRVFDVVAVIVGGILISPLLAALTLAVRLDSPGPVFYRQARIGRHGKHFPAWKFRSMRHDADVVLTSYLETRPELRAEWDDARKLKDDPRITRVGRLLRATSLDELPQLWNVLRGDMSLVGPRPIVDDEVPKYGEVFGLYTLVRPGITGHWQVSGRSDTSYAERVAMDAHYVRNWSIWFDVIILARTVTVVLKREGAY